MKKPVDNKILPLLVSDNTHNEEVDILLISGESQKTGET